MEKITTYILIIAIQLKKKDIRFTQLRWRWTLSSVFSENFCVTLEFRPPECSCGKEEKVHFKLSWSADPG